MCGGARGSEGLSLLSARWQIAGWQRWQGNAAGLAAAAAAACTHAPRLRMARAECCLAAAVPLRSTSTSSGMEPAGRRRAGRGTLVREQGQSAEAAAQAPGPTQGSTTRSQAVRPACLWRPTRAGDEALRLPAVGGQVGQRGGRRLLQQRRLSRLQHASQGVDGAKLGCLDLVGFCGRARGGQGREAGQAGWWVAQACARRVSACVLRSGSNGAATGTAVAAQAERALEAHRS